MRFLATSFSLVLGAWRLRITIDVDEDPDVRSLAMQHVQRRQANRREHSLH